MPFLIRTVSVLCLCSSLTAAEPLAFAPIPPKTPQDAVKSFHILDGFAMQLIAAEPLVTDPVAITYDEDGRAYVCEMNDYPYTDKESHKPNQQNPTDRAIGKVCLLEDTDGNGVFDKSTVFADGLSWPTGAACWKGGIFVMATPDLWYFKDTNGDGKADVREKVFTGFTKLNVQAVANNPIWGLDHRIYVAGGSNGASITRPDASEMKPVTIKRHDFSFDPETRDVQIESGGARFGNAFDDWGNRFLCNIRNPAQHVALPYRSLMRSPYLTATNPLHDAAEAGDQLPVYRTSPIEPWRDFRAKRWSAEGSTLPRSELIGAGVVTSSSGINIYRGDAYPAGFRDFAFVADVAGNLFYRLKLIPNGATFNAVQVDEAKNFCTSDDLWHRPVNFVNAPDGCLHVCDMYREVIEHPWSIPDDIHAAIDLLRGTDQGRIYRLAPGASFKAVPAPKLSKAITAELVVLLDHPNAWHRETAHRLLFERQAMAAVEPLRAMLKEGKTPQGRLHAMWSLRGLGTIETGATDFGSLTAKDLDQVLRNEPDQRVIAQAVHVATGLLGAAPLRKLIGKALIHTSTRLERNTPTAVPLAFALSELGPNANTSEALFTVYGTDPDDPYLRAAVLQAAMSAGPLDFIQQLGNPAIERLRESRDEMIAEVARVVTAKAPEKQVHDLTQFAQNADRQRSGQAAFATSALDALTQGMALGARQRGWTAANLAADPAGGQWWEEKIRAAFPRIASPETRLEKKLAVMPLIALGSFESAQELLIPLLAPAQPQELQIAALDVLTGFRDPMVPELLVANWQSFGPALRDNALTSFLSYPDRVKALLDAVESKIIPVAQISASTRILLTRNRDKAIADRAANLLDTGNSNRAAVVNRYAEVMFGTEQDMLQTTKGGAGAALVGDAERGAKIYETACMVCHKHGGKGNDVGPNLGAVKHWPPQQILTNILDPNREVSPNFALYIVETRDGRTLSGTLTSETAGNIILKRADGGEDQVPRADIKSLTSPGISIMPEGLEAAITPQQMADLIEFLRS